MWHSLPYHQATINLTQGIVLKQRASMCWPPTSVFPVTCFVAVHWPELWFHSQSDYCGRGCSEKWQIVNALTQLSYWMSQKACSLISAIKILNLMSINIQLCRSQNSYLSVFKLRLTLKASARMVVSLSPISLSPRL